MTPRWARPWSQQYTEIMTDNTPRLDLGTYAQGDEDWSHTDTVETLDELAVDRGPIDDRPASGDYDDEFYYATDQRVLWRWDVDADDWEAAGGLGSSSQRVPGTTYLSDADIQTLADSALDGEIDTTQLSDEAVTAAKIGAAAVDSGAIASDAVTVDELASALGTDSSNKIPGETYFEDANVDTLEAGQLSADNVVIDKDSNPSTHSAENQDVASGSTQVVFDLDDPVDVLGGYYSGERPGAVTYHFDNGSSLKIGGQSTRCEDSSGDTYSISTIFPAVDVTKLEVEFQSNDIAAWYAATV